MKEDGGRLLALTDPPVFFVGLLVGQPFAAGREPERDDSLKYSSLTCRKAPLGLLVFRSQRSPAFSCSPVALRESSSVLQAIGS